MTRIIAGRARSVRLSVPSAGTRPTSERVREALFSTLESWDAISGARVLDLYAGSGALGLEAASRGAASVVLVERNAKAAALCRANAAAVVRSLGPDSVPIDVSARSVRSHLTVSAAPADLVLVDPPYDVGDADIAEDLAGIARVLAPRGVVVVERSTRSPEPVWPSGIAAIRSRAYGETTLWFAEAETAAEGETATEANTGSWSDTGPDSD
ncbi:16S rRNA (guanine(966)-N(2))-methyltransferase RsmD [Labedella endophytica]|uniref:16S rRNA (Guanine(966)-N(2))-methyltransferase RsmD n=1 Tax=Labedella endophytica TaxID=1523160 RepID=A0A3S0VDQ4_9MICO|nr:16S rRNA (guanine(966)-N(2))-methyltransferase RsmD [Labedella endophytica]RUQ97598.1 16S rRNA (guanine(966)-N(2))-methyltransferase RsmD [Labedella endophytica]